MANGGRQYRKSSMSIKEPLDKSDLPLNGILVLDFSQFLAGPVAAMRLADMGARVIKIERPGTGDIGRTLAFAGLEKDGDTLSFHIMNRNKESFAADLKKKKIEVGVFDRSGYRYHGLLATFADELRKNGINI